MSNVLPNDKSTVVGISGPTVVIPAKMGCCSFSQVFVTPLALRKSTKNWS
jgi:hypothetical protein